MEEAYIIYEEYKLIERDESEVSAAWKSAHILLFFLAFVFGSFCTFCFHMLMYMFDEKCVLFPKLILLTPMKQGMVIYDLLPTTGTSSGLPVDFMSTQWVEQSTCYLPTYVPLVSGIFGLVWTTMFLMCSAGSRTLTGLQHSWRVLPPVFIFSLAMGSLCVYESIVTHSGLNELCAKLGEVIGSKTCSYTVNVVTLAYERRIRGVYQAIKLTILSAWLHTASWVGSALLVLLRVILAVDFKLIRIRAELHADIDRIMERHEEHVQTVSPDIEASENNAPSVASHHSTKVHFKNKLFSEQQLTEESSDMVHLTESDLLFMAHQSSANSELSLVPEEKYKLTIVNAYRNVNRENRFIVRLIYNIIDSIDYSPLSSKLVNPYSTNFNSLTETQSTAQNKTLKRQRSNTSLLKEDSNSSKKKFLNPKEQDSTNFFLVPPSTSHKKSSLKHTSVQTDEQKSILKVKIHVSKKEPKVDITEDKSDSEEETTQPGNNAEGRKKEKQD